MFKDNNIMNGKGEEDIDWITVKGAHIPVKKDESKEKAIKDHFEKIKQCGNTIHKLGNIDNNGIIKQVLGDRLHNLEFGISPNYQRHIEKRHENVFDNYRKDIPRIINAPDIIAEGNVPNRVVLIKRIDRQVEMILELSVNEKRSNQIVSMWTTTNNHIKSLTKRYKILYKRHNV